MMGEIVMVIDGSAVTTTLAIAEGTQIEHASVIKLARTYEGDLAEFGGVRFEIEPFETAGGAQQREVAYLNEQQSTLLLTYMRNSEVVRSFKKRLVRKFWEMAEQMRGHAQILTPAQMFLQSAQVMADIERRQIEQAETVARIELRIDEVEQKTQVLPTCPTHAEPITRIRRRINEKYGLPSRIIDEVIRQSPYSPKPAGTVRNSREEADGATYEVFWIKDVNQIFKRFVSECEAMTETQYVHPFIEGRFRMRVKEAA
ncbi:Rha family transcriptional regulator [Paraburkholderia sp. SIMBA_054]|uniref:Rha family transcriptional regulator n=1 Tax=Paraburkholderia sp. SIMBA_054 TaxID=3085795 RepID=UPI0039782915